MEYFGVWYLKWRSSTRVNRGEYRVCDICFYQEDKMIQQGVFANRYPHSFTDGNGARKSVEIESSRQSTDSKTRKELRRQFIVQFSRNADFIVIVVCLPDRHFGDRLCICVSSGVFLGVSSLDRTIGWGYERSMERSGVSSNSVKYSLRTSSRGFCGTKAFWNNATELAVSEDGRWQLCQCE